MGKWQKIGSVFTQGFRSNPEDIIENEIFLIIYDSKQLVTKTNEFWGLKLKFDLLNQLLHPYLRKKHNILAFLRLSAEKNYPKLQFHVQK